ncbi:MAG: TolC family protein [Gemmatimonadota bacterium]|nr:TolC family protein [Gemmatimonadota bacterium]
MVKLHLEAPAEPMVRGRTLRAAAVLLVGLVFLSAPEGLLAQQRDTLRLVDAVDIALDANPSLKAARLRADAAAERVPQAGAWHDPMLSFGLMNRPLSGFGTSEPMTMNSIQLTQRFPWPGQLGFKQQRARHLAAAEALDADEMERSLVARVSGLYFHLAYSDRAIAIMVETRDLLRNFLDVSSTRYTVGAGLQQDVLQAQVAVARMSEDITVMQQERIAMAARLNALLGRHAAVAIPGLVLLPPGNSLPRVDSLLTLATTTRPALLAAQARVEAAEAGYRQARRELYPEFMVSLAYSERPQFDDMATVMLGMTIPLFAGAKQLPMRREMAAMKATEEAMERDLLNETYATLTELRAEADRAHTLSRLYAEAILPQAAASVESALSAYRVGEVDYMTLVENEMTVNRYRIETARLAADYHRAVAELEALVGSPIGGTP